MQDKLLLASSIEMLLVAGGHSGETFCQCPFIPLRPFNPIDYGGDDQVPPLGLHPIQVFKVPEVFCAALRSG